jgi:hypothetical protein
MGKLINTFERKEKKYVLDCVQFVRFMDSVGYRLEDDQYAYSTISSLYYDTPQFSMINRSLEKPLYKEKLRVRSYGTASDEDTVFVELKKKFKGIVYKRRIQMSDMGARAYLMGMPYGQAALLGGQSFEDAQEKNPLQNIREIDACLARYETIEPGIMIIVERHSMRTNDGTNVRITFDMNARWRARSLSFDAGFGGMPLFSDGSIIMEVKALNAYPLWLVHALDELQAYPISCSKVGKAYVALARGDREISYTPRWLDTKSNDLLMKGAYCA